MLIGLVKGSDTLRFFYDAAGQVAMVEYEKPNETIQYYYLRNGQGDIVKILDGSGTTKVQYSYDSWGRQLSCTGTLASTFGVLNLLRYRGYVYDEETQWYYLKSRYYAPEICRFISADVLLSTGQGVLGHNSYAYCGDNPISRTDTNGSCWDEFWEWLKSLFSGDNDGSVETSTATPSVAPTPILIIIPGPTPSPLQSLDSVELIIAIAKRNGATQEALTMIECAASHLGAPYQDPPRDKGAYNCASLVCEAAKTIDGDFSGSSCRKHRIYYAGDGKYKWSFQPAKNLLEEEIMHMRPVDFIYWDSSQSHGHVAIYIGEGFILDATARGVACGKYTIFTSAHSDTHSYAGFARYK